MRRFRIKTTLSAIFIAIGTMVALYSAYSLERLKAVNGTVAEIVNIRMPTLEKAKNIEVRLGDIRTAYRNHILLRDSAAKLAATRLIDASVKLFDENSAGFEKLSSDEQEQALLAKIRTDFAAYIEQGKDVLALSERGKEDEAAVMLRSVMMKRAEALRNNAAALAELTKKSSQRAYSSAEQSFSVSFALAVGSVTVLLVMIIGAIWFVVASVAKPVERITSAMRTLATGDTAKPIPFAGRADEIGEMAEAVEVFRKNALENTRLEAEAVESRVRGEREQQRHAQEQMQRAMAMEQATLGLGMGLRHLAQGDLGFRLLEAFTPDFEQLRADFNSAAETLRQTLSEVARTTGSIDNGSIEISGSVDDLSRRTEQQAAALEETAAALDQITVNVTQSAKRAEEARQAAQMASQSTDKSSTIVAEAVDAMVKIESSSEQISGIIGVIDEIAFQTNLLALNAGVEAARAGEAGKGFAVVAQEVRELAQRSATAAREIKSLIQQSNIDVESGVRLVKDTGEALRTIEGHVRAINANMGAIATSAKEQSAGLGQVNTAVNQMDQVTQQNAAMVEETNAASASLAAEANRLRELVNRFSLGDTRGEHLEPRQAMPTLRAGASPPVPRLSAA
jgi:methyl-accepting chemotaxis protein